ncbi:DUF2163 domain-containing protein [Brevundimonas sp. S30B]|uniref:DUF2163 domain-containing protein n=1 Tax=unclassified Brevundimonas TaxID=2622653 RepID=UPI001072AB22|nr:MULTISPECIES: DUF2163 domain-containing protein [unclassified Brevundimonas]QBX38676.1 DUF2163 domain-containing protein [Brevundimonas sp. MF30-B]TFW01267.1 DUF2163 domain-containing protein [Brevundimonas sp. S30B]
MPLNASLDAALKGAAPLVCLLLKIELPDHTIRITDGAGQVVFGGETYSGEDAVYGTLDQVETVAEQIGTEAPKVRFGFLPASLAALASITNPANQGAPVSLWFAAVNPSTGLLIGDPELLFLGELDTADTETSEGSTLITFDVASAWERLFDASEGQRLNNTFIQSVWPGARGAEFVSQVQRDLPWGYDAPRPAVVRDGYTAGVPGSGGNGAGGGWRYTDVPY